MKQYTVTCDECAAVLGVEAESRDELRRVLGERGWVDLGETQRCAECTSRPVEEAGGAPG